MMKTKLFGFPFLVFAGVVLADLVPTNEVYVPYGQNPKYHSRDVMPKYFHHDFGPLFISEGLTGKFGESQTPIVVSVLSATKDKNPSKYILAGKIERDGRLLDFQGQLKLLKMREVKALHFGKDEHASTWGIKAQGVLDGNFRFNEDSKLNGSGAFEGKVKLYWYLGKDGKIHYDNIEEGIFDYENNVYSAHWFEYGKHQMELAYWTDK